MNIATIANLQVNTSKKLNNETKKNLVNIIENEFCNQSTIYNERNKEAREKVLEAYHKKVNYKRLRDAIQRKEQELENAKDALKAVCLDTDGEIISLPYNSSRELKNKVEEVRKLLESVEKQTPNNVKNKIISRLWIADNMGEAMVILREVLGNGIIPTVTKEQLALSYKETSDE